MRATVCFVGMLFLAGCNVEGATDGPPQARCSQGSADVLAVVDWSATLVGKDGTDTVVALTSSADKPIRMVDASIKFVDALGGSIGSMAVGRDMIFDPGHIYMQDGMWGPNTFERLHRLRKDEVSTVVCVRAVLYEDGTTARFD